MCEEKLIIFVLFSKTEWSEYTLFTESDIANERANYVELKVKIENILKNWMHLFLSCVAMISKKVYSVEKEGYTFYNFDKSICYRQHYSYLQHEEERTHPSLLTCHKNELLQTSIFLVGCINEVGWKRGRG